MNRKKRVPVPPPAAAPPVSGAPRCQQVFSPLSSVREEDGGSGHAVISSPLSQTCPRVHGSGQVGCFLLTFGHSSLPDGVSAAASQPPLLGSSVATSLPAGISTLTTPFSPFFPSFLLSYLPLTDSRSPVNVELQGGGGGLTVNQSEAPGSAARDRRGVATSSCSSREDRRNRCVSGLNLLPRMSRNITFA